MQYKININASIFVEYNLSYVGSLNNLGADLWIAILIKIAYVVTLLRKKSIVLIKGLIRSICKMLSFETFNI